MKLKKQIFVCSEFFRLATARLRAHRWALVGARIAPKCLIGKDSRLARAWNISLGTRCTLEAGVWLNSLYDTATIKLGDYTFVGRHVQIESAQSITIGEGCLLGPQVYITDHHHGMEPGLPIFKQPCPASPVVIGNDVWIGVNAVILPGVTIGDGAVVGAGAVVTRDVAAGSIVAGIPAKHMRTRQADATGREPT